MKKDTIISIILSLMVIIIVILTSMLYIRQTGQQFFDLCSNYDWNGTHNYTGDLTGEINCSQIRIDMFDNDGWTEICSDFPFSAKLSCHTLCNIDCELDYKRTGVMCVC